MTICPKCKYQQYLERVYTDQGALSLWRCIGCGDATDEIVLKHRQERNKNLHVIQPRLLFTGSRRGHLNLKQKMKKAV